MEKQKMIRKWRFDAVDIFVVILLTFWMFLIIIPFVNAISISFATQKEYVDNPLMLFPSQPTLQSYEMLFNDYRIWTGFRTSFFAGAGGSSAKYAFDYSAGVWHQPGRLSGEKNYNWGHPFYHAL